jgi:WD40 repeat protein
MKYSILCLLVLFGLVVPAQTIEVEALPENRMTSKLFHARFWDDHTLVFSGPQLSGVHYIDFSTLEVSKSIYAFAGGVDKFEFSPDRQSMVVADMDSTIVCWDLKGGSARYSIMDVYWDYSLERNIYFPPHDTTFGVSIGCEYLFISTATGKKVDSILTLPDECMNVLVFTQDGKKVYVGGNSRVWEYDLQQHTPGLVQEIGEIPVVTEVEFSPDEKQLAVATRESLMLLEDNLKKRIDLIGHEDWVKDIAFSPDGKFLYSCSGSLFGTDQSVRVWDTKTGNCLATMTGHSDDIWMLDVSPDGRWVVTASLDHTLKIWSTAKRELVCTIVPMKIGETIKLFYYTPSGLLYGPEEFYRLVSIQQNGKTVSPPVYNAEKSKTALLKLFK